MDDDEIRAEHEYLLTREQEILGDLERAAQDLAVPEITEAVVQVELDGAVEALRRSGNDAIEAEPSRAFRASELKTVSGVPKKYVRRALTVNGDGVTGVPGVAVSKLVGKKKGQGFRFTKSR